MILVRLLIKIEIRKLKDKREIDIQDEDWAGEEEEHRESAVVGMAALSLGLILLGLINLLLVSYIDALTLVPPEFISHFEKFTILLPMGCFLVASILWMFHEIRTETRELAVFIAALFLTLLTILHVVALRLVSYFRPRG